MNNHKFTENFVVISKGELSLYSFDPKLSKVQEEKWPSTTTN